jgi:hypothetical protein
MQEGGDETLAGIGADGFGGLSAVSVAGTDAATISRAQDALTRQ